jgi:hypothetical protein
MMNCLLTIIIQYIYDTSKKAIEKYKSGRSSKLKGLTIKKEEKEIVLLITEELPTMVDKIIEEYKSAYFTCKKNDRIEDAEKNPVISLQFLYFCNTNLSSDL